MNCEKFENLVTDMARGQLMETGLRQEAIFHTKGCETCSARFAQEQNLSVALRALALLDENRKADHQLEAHLLTAFRNRAKTVSVQPAVVARQTSATSQRRIYWWAAAAVILIALTFLALRIQNHPSTPQSAAKENQVQPQAPNNSPQNETVKPNDNLGSHQDAPVEPNKNNDGWRRKNPPRQAAAPGVRVVKNNQRPTAAPPDSRAVEEIATSFIPLYNIPMTDGGQVVRVELPRSALSTFGLPVNAALADRPVKADVVIGNDGIARAIRFVR